MGDLTITPVSFREACAFVSANHREPSAQQAAAGAQVQRGTEVWRHLGRYSHGWQIERKSHG